MNRYCKIIKEAEFYEKIGLHDKADKLMIKLSGIVSDPAGRRAYAALGGGTGGGSISPSDIAIRCKDFINEVVNKLGGIINNLKSINLRGKINTLKNTPINISTIKDTMKRILTPSVQKLFAGILSFALAVQIVEHLPNLAKQCSDMIGTGIDGEIILYEVFIWITMAILATTPNPITKAGIIAGLAKQGYNLGKEAYDFTNKAKQSEKNSENFEKLNQLIMNARAKIKDLDIQIENYRQMPGSSSQVRELQNQKYQLMKEVFDARKQFYGEASASQIGVSLGGTMAGTYQNLQNYYNQL